MLHNRKLYLGTVIPRHFINLKLLTLAYPPVPPSPLRPEGPTDRSDTATWLHRFIFNSSCWAHINDIIHVIYQGVKVRYLNNTHYTHTLLVILKPDSESQRVNRRLLINNHGLISCMTVMPGYLICIIYISYYVSYYDTSLCTLYWLTGNSNG